MSVGKLIVKDFGQTIGVDRDNFVVKSDGQVKSKIPFYKVNEIVVASKNAITTDALLWASIYNVDVLFAMHNGKPLAFLNSMKDKANVEVRLNQFRAYESSKGLEIAKSILLKKIDNEEALLKHLGLKCYSECTKLPSIETIANLKAEKMTQQLRLKLQVAEEAFTRHFYKEIFPLFPKWLQVSNRKARNATEPMNNLLNISYELLEWKIIKAAVKSKLEPDLGFLHSLQKGKPSLVCDLTEPFRPYVINFLLGHAKKLKQKDFRKAFVKDRYP